TVVPSGRSSRPEPSGPPAASLSDDPTRGTMPRNNSPDDNRNRARENARQIAATQAKKEKTAKTILYVATAVIVVAVLAVLGALIFQQNKPAVSPENYVADGLTVGKDNTPVQPLKMPEGGVGSARPERGRRE